MQTDLLALDPAAFDALARARWSPYVYAPTPVDSDDLRAVFSAAQTAPSSRNEQPWRFVVGTRGDAAFERILATLNERNRVWARHAPVLAVAFSAVNDATGRPNGSARYDAGAAMAVLSLAATARGLQVHQMGGFDKAAAQDAFGAPAGYEAAVAFALGSPHTDEHGVPDVPEDLRARDYERRARRPFQEVVFGAAWGEGLAGL